LPDPEGTVAQRELARHLAITEGRRDSWQDVYSGLALEQLVPSPEIDWKDEVLSQCADVYRSSVLPADGRHISNEDLGGLPAWVCLEYLVSRCQLLMHGSNEAELEEFTPRRAGDTFVGGEVPKVYAAASGLMAIFFAIVDRRRLWDLPCVPAINAIHATWKSGDEKRQGYWFVVDHRALPHQPWRKGTVYILPRGSFETDYKGMQWYSLQPVRPLARLEVKPEDFPLLHEIRGIDWFEDARRGILGAPFRDDPLLYPPA
jgi:hypothetical protein